MIYTNGLSRIRNHRIGRFSLLLFFLSLSAHKTDSAFDNYFDILTFFLLIGTTLLHLLRGKRFVLKGFTIWYIVFCIFAFSSYSWAVYNRNDVFQFFFPMMQALGIFIFLPVYIDDEQDLVGILQLIIVSLAYAALLLLIKTPYQTWGTERMGEAIGLNPNLLGVRMAVGAVLAFFLRKNEPKKTKYTLAFVLFSMLAVFSGSKKAFIMLIGGLAFFQMLNTPNVKTAKYAGSIFFFIIGFSIFIYALFNNTYLYTVMGQRIERFFLFFVDSSLGDKSTRTRMSLIEIAQSLFRQHPIIGVGLNNFKSYLAALGYAHPTYSHNNYWELLSCLGIVGTTLFYGMHARIVYKLGRLTRKTRSPLGITLLVIIVFYLICDYASVSYRDTFQYIIMYIAYQYIEILQKKYLAHFDTPA